MTSTRDAQQVVAYDDGALALTVSVDADGAARLTRLGPGRGTAGTSGPAASPAAGSAEGPVPAPAGGTVPAPAGGSAEGPVPAPAGGTVPAPAGGSAEGPVPAPAGGPATDGAAHPGVPLVDVLTPSAGRSWSGSRHTESTVGARLRLDGFAEQSGGPWHEYQLRLTDPGTGLCAVVHYRILIGAGVLRAWARLVNQGSEPLTVESATSFVYGGLPADSGTGGIEDLDLLWAESDWLAEGRWQRRPLRDALPDTNRRIHPANPRGCFGFGSHGSWSTATHLPMGALEDRRTRACWAWQIDHNGAWRWEVGESMTGAYLALLGPTDADHQWRQPLPPGASFTTVPVAVAVSGEGFEGAIGGLTRYRRAIRRPHHDHRKLPVIFNDYMNTLMANPTTERLLPLISAAARAGAEYFCVDAGWYDDGAGWWALVGDWKPAPNRFPGGLGEVLHHIRKEGMIPGLWLEPEVAGVGTAAAAKLPDEAFFQRGGVRVEEHRRYHLDLRHPAAVKHLDETADFLVGDLGVGYLKLDYNIKIDPGTDAGGASAGAGLLGHNRAFLDWLDRLLDRYPDLIIENCASGAMRADYAMLSRLQIQSTSDQQDFLRYPVIAAAAAAAMTPEQAGIWSYPQPVMGEQENAFTLCGALLGRIHLSGHLDKMSAGQQDLVSRAVAVYKQIRPDLPASLPFWPLGMPRWTASWVATGLRVPGRSYVLAWWRGPLDPGHTAGPGDHGQTRMIIPHLRGRAATAEILFPGETGAQARWEAASGELTVTLPQAPSACLIRLATAPGLDRPSAHSPETRLRKEVGP